MTNNSNFINSIESNETSNKSSRFIENTKRAVRKVFTTAGITIGSMGPVATPTIVPTSVNTITTIAPLASTTIKTIGLGTAAGLLAACSGGEDGPDGPIDTKDTVAPTINISKSEVDITGGKQVRIDGNQLYIGDFLVASWSDNKSKNCNVSLSLNGKSITSGTTISEEGTLTIKVSDTDGNNKNADIKLNVTKKAPSITVNQYEINIFGGVKVSVKDNQLLLGDEVIASRNDENLESCKVTLNFNGREIHSGDAINEAGKLTLTITNKNEKSSTAEITITNNSISGIENLTQAQLQVDKEINLLNGITFYDGIELSKTEIEIDGQRSTITDPNHYIPEYPGTCSIIFTLKGKTGNTAEVKVDNLTIKPLEYKALEINNIRPVDILPIIGQVESGDKKAYEHIEHLRVAESTRIRDMMRKYGASNHSAEEYKQLMSRLNTGMIGENPKGYNNYETIGGNIYTEPSYHAHDERNILNTLIDHVNYKIIDSGGINQRFASLQEAIRSNPDNINIFGNSMSIKVNKEAYNNLDIETFKKICKAKNLLLFLSGGNIEEIDGILKNKIYHENINGDNHGVYSLSSSTNGKNDTHIDKHLIVTIGTNANGDIDQTNEYTSSSKYPVGFHNKVLFAGRDFPYLSGYSNKIEGTYGKYPTSYTNYLNVAMADLCFQMFAEVKDIDELLEMIRSSSELRDHIRFNGEDQPLILMNPAGFFQKYLMPRDLPSNIQSSKNTSLNKGYYKGVIFDIPGAEVKINGERVGYNDTNKSKIKSQNPMTLEWRVNGNLCRKLGYKGKNIEGKIIVVDDKWNGLNIDKEFSINIQ